MAVPVALTIAGSDPSGGAGIQADLKTFHQFGVYGEAVITLVTVQNTQRVNRVEYLPPDLVEQQIQAVMEDIRPGAAKAGALGTVQIVETVARLAAGFDFPLVVDPVMHSSHGTSLLGEEARRLAAERLFPLTALLTPNLYEAEVLTGLKIRSLDDMRRAAESIYRSGVRAVLIKGGHLPGDPIDLLLSSGECTEFPGPRILTQHTHGTGCTYSAAITAELAKGTPLAAAVRRAKQFVTLALRNSLGLGKGAGPVNHHVQAGS